MLTSVERWLFLVCLLISVGLTARGVYGVVGTIRRGARYERATFSASRLLSALAQLVLQRRTFRDRPLVGFFHLLVVWGFLYYGLVNVGDLLEGFIPRYRFLGNGLVGGLYRLGADVLSVGVLVGVVYLAYRRFIQKPQALAFPASARLHPKARQGIPRDSAIVLGFIGTHVGARFLGQSFRIALAGGDPWQPFAGTVALLWGGMAPGTLTVAEHIAWWLSLGLILAFLPYFPYSKHFHLVMAPINLAISPQRPALGTPAPIPLSPAARELGSARLETLPWARLVDAFACVMCYRCQEVCPATMAGTVLSPAVLEINKRYELRDTMVALATGRSSSRPLTGAVMPEDGVWACTTCAACVEVCPVGNEPMHDLIDIRRYLTLTEGRPPARAGQVLRHIRFTGNPWGENPEERGDWAVDTGLPLMADVQETEVLYWVGCSGSFDPRGQNIARAVARLLQRAGVDVAILGPEEWCTGDPARRMGEEALFHKCRQRNLATLQKYRFRTLLTSCPHCWNVWRNEADGLSDKVEVVHHTQFLRDLLAAGRLRINNGLDGRVTFHDPCYLGRHNGEFQAPRDILRYIAHLDYQEMPRHGPRSLCCGGGGGGVFYDVPAKRRIPDIRLEEARQTGAQTVATACPYCAVMFEGSPHREGVHVQDVAEILLAITEE